MNDENQMPLNEPVEPVAPSASRSTRTSTVPFHKTSRGRLVIGIVGVLVVLGLVSNRVYARPVTDGYVRAVSTVLPLPALKVNGEKVTIRDFLIEYDALTGYFSQAGEQAPPLAQLEVAIVDTLLNKVAVRQIAREYGVTLDEERVDLYMADVIAAQESEAMFEENLEATFGWGPDAFRERIVESIVLALQMEEEVLASDVLQSERAAAIESAYGRVQSGESFLVVAKEVSGAYPGIETDLGYVNLSVIPDAWRTQVETLEVGTYTDIIELPEGYVIFQLEERVEAAEDTQLRLYSITVPKVVLEDVVDAYLANASVKRYVGELAS